MKIFNYAMFLKQVRKRNIYLTIYLTIYHPIMTDNYSVDKLHNAQEDLCNIDMIHILSNLSNGKYKRFDLISLNNRMLMFNYGPKHSINKPPCHFHR